MVNVAQRIREMREEKGMSTVGLSSKLGFSKGLIEKFEAGKQTPSKEQAKAIAIFFGVSESYVRAETNDPTRQDSWMDMTYDIEEETKEVVKQAEKPKTTKEDYEDKIMLKALLTSDFAKSIISEIVAAELKKLGYNNK